MKVTLLAPWLSRECQEPECQEPAQHAQGRMIFLRERIVLLKEALSSHAGEALNAVRKHPLCTPNPHSSRDIRVAV